MTIRSEVTRFYSVELGGDYVARNENIVSNLATMSKTDMIRRCRELWPELFKSREWTTKKLRRVPAYQLAIVISQI